MKPPMNVIELNEDGIKKFLDSFDHVLSDCDGVIWSPKKPYPDTGKFFDLMKKYGKTVHYVSNNSLRNKENYTKKFQSCGIYDGFENLTVPSTAIAEYLKEKKFTKKVYCVTCPETINILETNGFKCVYGPDDIFDDYTDFVLYIVDDPDIGAVVFDSDWKVNLPKLYKACTYLQSPEVLFLNGATDRAVALKPGYVTLGTGVFTDLVAEHTNRTPVQLGKPCKEFAEFAMKRAGITNPERVLFIGDMIEQDVALGKVAGFKTLLVLTSNHKAEMLAQTKLIPDYYAPDLGSIVLKLKNTKNAKHVINGH